MLDYITFLHIYIFLIILYRYHIFFTDKAEVNLILANWAHIQKSVKEAGGESMGETYTLYVGVFLYLI